MTLNEQDIKNIANISKINFNEEQINLMTNEINNLLKLLKKIDDVNNMDAIEELYSPIYLYQDINLFLREDIIDSSSNYEKKILENAPEVNNNLFLVPRVIE